MGLSLPCSVCVWGGGGGSGGEWGGRCVPCVCERVCVCVGVCGWVGVGVRVHVCDCAHTTTLSCGSCKSCIYIERDL